MATESIITVFQSKPPTIPAGGSRSPRTDFVDLSGLGGRLNPYARQHNKDSPAHPIILRAMASNTTPTDSAHLAKLRPGMALNVIRRRMSLAQAQPVERF